MRCILIRPRCRRSPLEEYALTNDDAGSLAPPTAIGPYRVLHQVGAGVLGPVFRAHGADADREVAIKLFRLDLTPEQARSLADALARTCTRLPEHDHVAAPRAAGLVGSSAWLACDYVPADALDSRLRRRSALGLRHALPILRQVAAALDAASAAGISHGSLHPRDVLVSTTGEVHVTGFGVADAVDAAGGAPVVRRPYTAPERAGASRGPADASADVFALGAIAVELLTGRRLVGTGAAAVGLVSGVSEGVDADVCRRALARALADNPADRYSSAKAFVDALARAVDDETLPARDEPAREAAPVGGPSRRRPLPGVPAAARLQERGEPAGIVEPPAASAPEPALAPAPAPEPVVPPAEMPATELPAEAVDSEPVAAANAPIPAPASPDVRPPRRVAPPVDEGGVGETHTPSAAAHRLLVPARDEIASQGEPVMTPALSREDEPARAPGDLQIRQDVVAEPSAHGPAWAPRDEISPRGSELSMADRATGSRVVGSRAALAASLLVGIGLGLLGGYVTWGWRPAPVATSKTEPTTAVGASLPPSTSNAATAPAASVEPPARAEQPAPTPSPRPTKPTSPDTSSQGTTRQAKRSAETKVQQQAAVRPGAKGPCRVEFVSRPAGARIYVDGRLVGATPLTLETIAAGARAVRLQLDGYRPWATTVNLVPGQRARLAASLELTAVSRGPR